MPSGAAVPAVTRWQRRNSGSLVVTIDTGADPLPLQLQQLSKTAEKLRLPLVWGVSSLEHWRSAGGLANPLVSEIALRVDPRAVRLPDVEQRLDEFAAAGHAVSTAVVVGKRPPFEWRRDMATRGVFALAGEGRLGRRPAIRGVGVAQWESLATLRFPSRDRFFPRRWAQNQLRSAAAKQPARLHARIVLPRVAAEARRLQVVEEFLAAAADYRDRGMLRVLTLSEQIRQIYELSDEKESSCRAA